MEDGGLPTQQAIGIVVAILIVLGWVLYLFANSRRTKPEVGSEIELAANRKPYLSDDQLEGALGCQTVVNSVKPRYLPDTSTPVPA